MRNDKEEIQRQLRGGLTVADLIAELQNQDPDAIVVFQCDYGDYNHTQQALPIEEVERMQRDQRLENSAYSHSGLSIAEEEEVDEDDLTAEERLEYAEVKAAEAKDRPKIVILK